MICSQRTQGNPWTATYIQAKGEPIADIYEDMAAEQKARVTYEWLITLSDDHDVKEVLKFLREREIVHFQRFGEALMKVQDALCKKQLKAQAIISLNDSLLYCIIFYS